MAGNRTDPSNVGVENRYAGFVAPSRPDASTVGPGGNTVDRGAIPKTMTRVSSSGTQAKPGGVPSA